jgi:hypothetical protein
MVITLGKEEDTLSTECTIGTYMEGLDDGMGEEGSDTALL